MKLSIVTRCQQFDLTGKTKTVASVETTIKEITSESITSILAGHSKSIVKKLNREGVTPAEENHKVDALNLRQLADQVEKGSIELNESLAYEEAGEFVLFLKMRKPK